MTQKKNYNNLHNKLKSAALQNVFTINWELFIAFLLATNKSNEVRKNLLFKKYNCMKNEQTDEKNNGPIFFS